MASVEQVDSMIELLKQQQLAMQDQLAAILKLQTTKSGDDSNDGKRGNRTEKLNPKAFIGVKEMDGKDKWDQWSWAMKYRLKVENKEFAKIVDKVEELSEKEMKEMEDDMVGNNEELRSAELYGILTERVSGEAMTIVQSVNEGDGLMAWRSLFIAFNPKTLSGTLMKIIEAVRPHKVNDVDKVIGEIAEWEKKYRKAWTDVKGISERGCHHG